MIFFIMGNSAMRNYKINFGYGDSPKFYTLRGAKIAASRFIANMPKTGLANKVEIVRFENGASVDRFYYYGKDN
jgi:hypothetical protein